MAMLGKHARTCSGIDFAVGGSPPSVAPSVGSDVARDLDIVTPYRIRDLHIGNEFLQWDLIAEISAEKRRHHKMIVLTPTLALLRQLCAIRAFGALRTGRSQRHPVGEAWRPILMLGLPRPSRCR